MRAALGGRHELTQLETDIHASAAQAADEVAAHHLFRENWSRLSPRTTRRHEGDLALSAMYLGDMHGVTEDRTDDNAMCTARVSRHRNAVADLN